MQLMSSEVGSSSRAIEGRRDKRAGGILWVLTPSKLLVRSYRRECSLGSCDGGSWQWAVVHFRLGKI